MTAYDWEDAIGRDPEAIGIAAARSPLDYPWGFYSGPKSAGTSIHVFQWFVSPHEMLTWLQKAEPVRFYEDAAEVTRVSEAIRSVVGSFEQGSPALAPGTFEAAYAPLRDVLEIIWFGRFEDLRAGMSEFAVSLREDFRQGNGDPNASIDDHEIEEFVQFLRHGGM